MKTIFKFSKVEKNKVRMKNKLSIHHILFKLGCLFILLKH